MIAITAVDDRMGMTFNHRRQSQDRVLRQKILELAEGSALHMNEYSAGQFQKDETFSPSDIQVSEDFTEQAGDGEYCFFENLPLLPCQSKIERLILFRWNRKYPGDFFFDLDLTDGSWQLRQTEEFAGSSHEKITMEVYEHEIV